MKANFKSVTKFMMSITLCLLVMVMLIPMAYADNGTVALNYKLDGIICSKPSLKELKVGQSLWVNLAPESGLNSAALSVKIGEDIYTVDVVNGFIDTPVGKTIDPDFSYNPNTFYLLIPGTMVTGDVEITAVATGPDVVTYLVNQDLPEDGSIISSNVVREVATGEFVTTLKGEEPYTLTVTLADGMLPFDINTETGEVVGTGAIKDTDYIKYDKDTGELHITNIQANVRIAAKKTSEITVLDDLSSGEGKNGSNAIETLSIMAVFAVLAYEIFITFFKPYGTHGKNPFASLVSAGSSRGGSHYKGNH